MLKAIPCFRQDGKEYTYSEMPKEKAVEILKERIDMAGSRLQFERKEKTTWGGNEGQTYQRNIPYVSG